jgi:hypothetical protein
MRELSRWGHRIALVVGTVQGAIVIGVLWWLAGGSHAADPTSASWHSVLYNTFGVPSPVGSLVVASVLGGLLGFFLARLVVNEHKGEGPQGPNT